MPPPRTSALARLRYAHWPWAQLSVTQAATDDRTGAQRSSPATTQFGGNGPWPREDHHHHHHIHPPKGHCRGSAVPLECPGRASRVVKPVCVWTLERRDCQSLDDAPHAYRRLLSKSTLSRGRPFVRTWKHTVCASARSSSITESSTGHRTHAMRLSREGHGRRVRNRP
ncbi:hypothetical protein GY45DRAFT_865990 [Cubamyces sp. BRFM 1775]|nr:hypothetical protein GY45DRAFT_865990 [Cubamyces sp. BRFM 1775]